MLWSERGIMDEFESLLLLLKSNPKCRCSLAPSIKSGTSEEHLDPPIQFGRPALNCGHPGQRKFRGNVRVALEAIMPDTIEVQLTDGLATS
jgi:hypothetical protein